MELLCDQQEKFPGGAEIFTQCDQEGASAIHYASRNDHVKIVEWLVLSKRVSIMRSDSEKNTPLHIAAENESERVLEFLLQHGQNNAEMFTASIVRAGYPYILLRQMASLKYHGRRQRNPVTSPELDPPRIVLCILKVSAAGTTLHCH